MKQASQIETKKSKFALNFKSYSLAILVHVLLLGIIMFNLFWNPTKKIEVGGGDIEPIQAQVIDESILNQELEKLQQEDDLKKQQETEKQQNLENLEKLAEEKKLEIEKLEEEKKQKEELALETEKQEQQKIEELAKQRELEEEKTKEVEKKRLAEEARLKELALEKEKEEEQKKKKEEEALAQKKLEEAEKKRKLEDEKKKEQELAQKKLEEEKRKKEDAEKQRKEKELADRLAEEQAQTEARSQAADLFARYIGPIRNKVTNSWIRPGSVRPGAQAKVLVRVSPQGDVLTVKIQRASGDPIFDRSVVNAVYKASPLPIPNDARLYPHYRDFVFNFDPPG